VVEFQPSGFSKGSYLNVAAHWLWQIDDLSVLRFNDLADVERPWRAVEVGVPFDGAATELASIARDGVQQLRLRHRQIAETAEWLSRRADSQRMHHRSHYHAGVACGLAGRMDDARRHFRTAIDPKPAADWNRVLNVAAETMWDLAAEATPFRKDVVARIQLNRLALKLKHANVEQALT